MSAVVLARGGKSAAARLRHIDWVLIGATLPLAAAGLLTLNAFAGENALFEKQFLWLGASLLLCALLSQVDFHFLRRSNVIAFLFLASVALLAGLFAFGTAVHGAKSWFDFGSFAFQPSDPAKLVLILLLSKYFSKRHVEIAHVRHILVSGGYAFILFALVFLQPDFGSAVIVALLWLGMVLVSGISKRHLLAVFLLGAFAFGGLWLYGFED